MRPTLAQHRAIEAKLNMFFGAIEYDRLFGGFQIGKLHRDILHAFVNQEICAAEIELRYSGAVVMIAQQILKCPVSGVRVLPKVFPG